MAEELFKNEEIIDKNIDGVEETADDVLIPPEKNNRQRIIIISVVAIVILSSILFFVSSSGSSGSKQASSSLIKDSRTILNEQKKEVKKKKKKVKYIKMFNQLEGSETSKILKQLSINEIIFKTEQVGQKYSIWVDRDQEDEARNLLAMKGLPSGAFKQGFELLDDAQTLGVTEFDKRIRFLRALSGELEKAIMQLDIVESAKVQIVLPEQRLFTVTQPPVTSSIIIRLIKGYDISDEVVFSIIQLVSNSVENLQPENVSVVDTDGNLLSDGIFARLAAKRAGTFIEEEEERKEIEAVISREEAIGSPIIPNYEGIKEWFDIKWNFETKLKNKTEKQLYGVLPIASFKVEVTSDLGPLENGNIVDIKRQTISIVVDGLNEEIYLDQALKKQIFSTVAGAVGYVRGRDSIQLNVAEYPLYTEEEKQAIIHKYKQKGFFTNALYVLLVVALVAGIYFAVRIFLKRRKEIKKDEEQLPEKEIELDEDLDDFEEPQEEANSDEKIAEIKNIASLNPEVLAKMMEAWIQEEAQTQTSEVAGEIAGEEVVEQEVQI